MHFYAIAPDYNVALLRFTASVHGNDLITTIQAFHKDPWWQYGMDVIWDCRKVKKLVLEPEEMQKVMDLRTEDTEGRDASVVRREVDEMIATLYQQVASRKGKEAFVCHKLSEALKLLGLPQEGVWAALSEHAFHA